MGGRWLVVGLGNPGPEYAHNRHNVGFLVADLLAERRGVRLGRHRRVMAQVGANRLGAGADAPQVLLVKPLTYMNLSGGPVAALARYYQIDVAQLIAIHDELDLPFGQLRAKIGGGEGGHNGLRSLSRSLGTREYLRVRFGIGRPPGRQDSADYVLSDFPAAEYKELDLLLDRAADVVESIILRGLAWAQNTYHPGPPQS